MSDAPSNIAAKAAPDARDAPNPNLSTAPGVVQPASGAAASGPAQDSTVPPGGVVGAIGIQQPGSAALNTNLPGGQAAATDAGMPKSAKEVPLGGIQAGEGVSFANQVKGNAKMMAGKIFGKDDEAVLGAAIVRGHVEPPSKK